MNTATESWIWSPSVPRRILASLWRSGRSEDRRNLQNVAAPSKMTKIIIRYSGFGDGEALITTLKGYIEEINERIENKRVESVYLNALNEIKQADNKVKDMIENKSRTTVYVRLKNIIKYAVYMNLRQMPLVVLSAIWIQNLFKSNV